MCKIIDYLFLGSQDAAVNLEDLKKENVEYILNVATGIPNRFPELLKYRNVEVLDLDETQIVDYLPECFEFIDNAVKEKQGVLVHW